MDVSGWDWWIVLGAALEAIGVVALAIDIVVAFRRSERYRERDLVVYQGSPLEVVVTFPMEPSLEARSRRSTSAWNGLRSG